MSDEPDKPDTYHRGADHSAPYPVSRLAPAFSLVDLAREIDQANAMLAARSNSKLEVIAGQIRGLQDKAREVLLQTRQEQLLNSASCNFQRRPGQTCQLYRRQNGELYFSMLSPQDWGGQTPHHWLGAWRMENDYSWTAAGQPPEAQQARQQLRELLDEVPATDGTD